MKHDWEELDNWYSDSMDESVVLCWCKNCGKEKESLILKE